MNALPDALQLAYTIAICDKSPREKIEEIKSTIYPVIRREYQFGIPNWEEIGKISLFFDEIVNHSLGLSPTAHSAHLYSPAEVGCIGLIAIDDYVKILHLTNFLMIFWSSVDEYELDQAKYYFSETPETASILDHWKDRTLHLNPGSTKNVSRGIFWRLEMVWVNEQTVVLKTEANWKKSTVESLEVGRIEKFLKEMVQSAIYHKWTSPWRKVSGDFSGFVQSAARSPDVSAFYLKAGPVQLSTLDQMFIHQAKTGTTSLPDDPLPSEEGGHFVTSEFASLSYSERPQSSLFHQIGLSG